MRFTQYEGEDCSNSRGHVKIEDYVSPAGRKGAAVSTGHLCGCELGVEAIFLKKDGSGSTMTETKVLKADLWYAMPPTYHHFMDTDEWMLKRIDTRLVCQSLRATIVPTPPGTQYIKYPICLETTDNNATFLEDPANVGPGLASARRWDPQSMQYVTLASTGTVAPGEVVLLTYDQQAEGRRSQLLHVGDLLELNPLPLHPGDNLVTTPLDMGCTSPSELLDLLGPGYRIGTWDPMSGVTAWYPDCPTGTNAGSSNMSCGGTEVPLPGCSPIHVYYEPSPGYDGEPPTWPPTYTVVEQFECDAMDGP